MAIFCFHKNHLQLRKIAGTLLSWTVTRPCSLPYVLTSLPRWITSSDRNPQMLAKWVTAMLASSNWGDGIILGLLSGREEITSYGCLQVCACGWEGKRQGGGREKERTENRSSSEHIHQTWVRFLGQVPHGYQVQWPVPSPAWEHLRKEERSFFSILINIYVFFPVTKVILPKWFCVLLRA